jgi:tetratricopeptide (TPR) repeat protein
LALCFLHPQVATTLSNLALVYQEQGKYADAEGLFKRALGIEEKALGAGHPDVARTLNNLAVLSASSGNAENALAYSRKATASVIAHQPRPAWWQRDRHQFFHCPLGASPRFLA